tara:strand:- start:52 stop:756 length:705 start_codon:yes stop_codon:yes gene_type:complete
MKRLYVIGDSWCVNAWPELLGKKLGYELINDSVNGSSNDWIFRRLIEWISCQETTDDLFVIVGLTSPSRREENFNNYHPGGDKYSNEIDKFIYEKLYDNELAHLKSISYILAIQEFLKSKKIKYLLFDSWYDILNCESELISNRKAKNRYKFFNFDGNYFYKKDNKYDVIKGQYYSDELNIGKMINKIDSNYYIKPDNNSIRIRKENEDGHPTEKDCKDISLLLHSKIKELYDL